MKNLSRRFFKVSTVKELTTFEGSPFQTLTTRLKKIYLASLVSMRFPNYFVTVVSRDVNTVHCEIGVWRLYNYYMHSQMMRTFL